MGKKLGNEYRPWIESETAGTFHEIKGNVSLKVSRSAEAIDTSTKDDFPYGTEASGLRRVTIAMSLYPDLPDANGYGRLEARMKQADPTRFQIRKGGSAGTEDDVVFDAMMNIGSFDTDKGKNAPVQVDTTLSLAAVPTVDELA